MPPYHNSQTLHNAASATADGTILDCRGLSTVALQITGTFVATVTFQVSLDGTNYDSVRGRNENTGAVGLTATTTGSYRIPVAGFLYFKAPVTWTSGTSITVKADATTEASGDPVPGTQAGTDIGDVTINNASGASAVNVQDGGNTLTVDGTVTVGAITAGETHIGEVGGKTAVVSATPVLTVAGAYSANDFVGTSATAISFANAVRVSAGTGIIQAAVLTDYALQSLPLELWLFDTAITPPNDNAAWTLTDAHAATCIGVIPFSTYYASALNSVSPASGLGIAFKAVATTIYGVLVTRGAPTYATGDLTVRLVILQD